MQETAKSFMELRSSKRMVHFTGRSSREGVLFPEGSSTQDGRSPGVTIELPRTASYREVKIGGLYFLRLLGWFHAVDSFWCEL